MFAILDARYLDMWIRRPASVENAIFGSILRTIQNILKYRPFPTAEDGRVVPPVLTHTDAEFEALERDLAKVQRESVSLKSDSSTAWRSQIAELRRELDKERACNEELEGELVEETNQREKLQRDLSETVLSYSW